MVSRHRLNIFCQVIKSASFTKAAEQLLLNQSTISMHIASLEKACGHRLIKRSQNTKFTGLTEYGEIVYKYANHILYAYEAMEQELQNQAKKQEELMVLANPTTATYIMPRLIARFKSLYPNVHISMLVDRSVNIMRKLELEDIDIAFFIIPINLETSEFNRRGYCLKIPLKMIVSKKNFPFNMINNDLTLLEKIPLILPPSDGPVHKAVKSFFIHHKITPNIICESTHPEVAKQMVEEGMGATIMTKYAAASALQLNDSLAEISFNISLPNICIILTSSSQAPSSISQIFINYLRKNLEQHNHDRKSVAKP